MTTTRTICTIIVFLVTLTACWKNKTKGLFNYLPPETQLVKNTFGCLIDGQVFKPKGDPFGGPVIKAQYQMVNWKQGFGISARRSDGEIGQVVGIGGCDIGRIRLGIYELSSSRIDGRLSGGYSFSRITTLGNYYNTDSIRKGQINIKFFDTVNQIVSGTFWFDAIDTTTGKVVQIREGRFDLPYVR